MLLVMRPVFLLICVLLTSDWEPDSLGFTLLAAGYFCGPKMKIQYYAALTSWENWEGLKWPNHTFLFWFYSYG